MSVVGAPMLLGPVLGPVLGGLILQHLSWRWIFFVNLPIGALALALAFRLLPPTEPKRAERLDLVGLALLSPGLAAVVFGLSEIATKGTIGYVLAWAPIAGGLGFVLAFVWHALHTSVRPLLDLSLFRAPGFAAAAVAVLLIGAALFGSLILLPLYLQVDRGQSTLATGLLLTPQGIGAALTMPISGRLTDRIGGGPVVLFGLIVMTAATIALTQLTGHTAYWLTSAILVVRGLGLGCSMMPSMAAAYTTIARDAVPRATTALNVLQRVGGSIGTALLAVVLEQQIKASLPHVAGVGGGQLEPIPGPIRQRIAEPLAHAFGTTFWWAVALTAVAIAPAILLAFTARTGAAASAHPGRAPQPA
jgi:EmrB/QacA subfamily drug resistance transporter